MNIIPNLLKVEPDELLYSYILRLARANGFSDIRMFLNFFVFQDTINTKAEYAHITYDCKFDIFPFLETMGVADSPAAFVSKTSILPGILPLTVAPLAAQKVSYMCKAPGLAKFLTKQNKSINTLKLCPECRTLEEKKLGWFFYHRAHQMPGVTVCHEHGCVLLEYNGRLGKEFTDDSFIKIATELTSSEMEYATFCKDFLNAELPVYMDDIRKILKGKGTGLPYSTYLNPTTILSALLCTFGSVSAIADQIKANALHRNLLVDVVCPDCGMHYVSTESRISIGWGCPSCDSKIEQQVLARNLFHAGGNGEYELLSDYTSNNKLVKVRHNSCGKVFSVKPRSFLYENVRCSCNYEVSIDYAREIIENNGEFELIEFENTSKPIMVRATKCGHTFQFDFRKFVARPYCKVCKPRVRNHARFNHSQRRKSCGDYSKVCGNHSSTIQRNKCLEG